MDGSSLIALGHLIAFFRPFTTIARILKAPSVNVWPILNVPDNAFELLKKESLLGSLILFKLFRFEKYLTYKLLEKYLPKRAIVHLCFGDPDLKINELSGSFLIKKLSSSNINKLTIHNQTLSALPPFSLRGSTLKNLKLSCCRIGDKSLENVAAGLVGSSVLSLDLTGNPEISEISCLLQVLPETSLTHIFLGDFWYYIHFILYLLM